MADISLSLSLEIRENSGALPGSLRQIGLLNFNTPKNYKGLSKKTGGKNGKYDDEEENIINDYENGKMKLSTPLKKELEMGVPYQTLIPGLFTDIIEGESISKNG